VWKAQIAARYVGVEIEEPEFTIGKDNKTKEFAAKNPVQKVPVLETDEGCIFESNAIARYIARLGGSTIYGNSPFETAQIDQWMDFAVNEIELPSAAWLFPIMGIVPLNKQATSQAKGDIRKALAILDAHLRTRTFLVGHRVTLADITVSMVLYRLFKMVLDPGFRKAFGSVVRWFLTCVHQPQFKDVVGEVELCQKMLVAKAAPAQQAPKKEAQKEKAKETPQPAPAKPKQKKPQNPLLSLPPSSFDLEEWKRVYSNDPASKSIPWFWEHFDPEGYSIYFSDYKYNDECKKMFMTCNLIGGWIQRLDPLRKWGFGSVLIFGEEPSLEISGVWIFRGQDVPAEMLDCVDTEHHTFRKADLEKEKDLISAYLAWEGDFGDKNWNENSQGMNFK